MIRYLLACLTDTGVSRRHNEDNFAFFGNVMPEEHQASVVYTADVPFNLPFAAGVFDGMGGEAAGECASYEAAMAFKQRAYCGNWSNSTMLDAFEAMNDAVCDARMKKRVSSMGTTATVLAVENGRAYVANLGDSPAILLANGKLKTLSHKHTDVETLRLLGITHRKPGLTQYLGMSDGDVNPCPHIVDFRIAPGDVILIASDGLTEPLGEDAIRDVLAMKEGVSDRASLLRDMAIKGGGTDNITVLLCEAVASEVPKGM